MKIGQKIRNAREDMDLSQCDISQLIPMNQSNYSKIERDIQEPSLDQLKRICEILKLDPRYLLELDKFEFISPEDIKLLKETKIFLERNQLK
ncbi:MAG: helix-turn-helix transcriptional regulator [Clostridia bacterium]|nr:helix-turn-helix transcriptional regulator [Clostridia bacterium]